MNNNRFSGQKVLVTGGLRGIGNAVVTRLLSEDVAQLFLIDLDEPGTVDLAGTFGDRADRIEYLKADAGKSEEILAAVATVASHTDSLDALINNAGLQGGKTAEETSVDDWDLMLDINARGVFLFSRECLPMLRKSGSGSIVNLASGAGLVGMRERTAYCASKFAVIGLTKAMALDHGPENIRVNAVCPGMVSTRSSAYGRLQSEDEKKAFMNDVVVRTHALGRIGEPQDIASMITYLASKDSAFVTGAALSVDGGYTAQ